LILYLELEVLADQLANAGFQVDDYGLLEAALARARANLFGTDVYPALELKAAAIVQSILVSRPMLAANNRSAWFVLNAFLSMNGYSLEAKRSQVLELMQTIQQGKISLTQQAEWIATHKVPFA
jgi:death-on-curing protein